MGMIRKSFTLTERNDAWLKTQLATGHFGNESEIIRDLIRERAIRETETPEEIAAIRAALKKGEESGTSNRTVDEIFEEAKERYLNNNE